MSFPFFLRFLIFLAVSTTTLTATTLASSSSFLPGAADINMGTTILAVRYKDGVVVGADTRTSVSGYVSNRFASKITFVLDAQYDSFIVGHDENIDMSPSLPNTDDKSDVVIKEIKGEQDKGEDSKKSTAVTKKKRTKKREAFSTCCICRAGSSADTQHLSDLVRDELTARYILRAIHGSVTSAARLIRNIILTESHSNNNEGLSVSLICAGYDHILQRGVIYSVAPGGALMEETDFAIAGSGSSYALGFVDSHYSHGGSATTRRGEGRGSIEHNNVEQDPSSWDEEKALEFVAKAIELAMERDGSSGGFIRLYVINRHGKKSAVRIQQSKRPRTSDVDGEGKEREAIGESQPTGRFPPAVLKGFAPPSMIKKS